VDTASPSWCDVLNLDPRHRAAAGFGSLVVKQLQEDLMASAWKQVGAIDPVNNLLRAAQLGREASAAVHRRIGNLAAGLFARLAAPAAAHVRLLNSAGVRLGATALSGVVSSKLPHAAFDSALRRVARMRGPIRKRQFRATSATPAAFRNQTDFVLRLGQGTLMSAGPRREPVALFGISAISTVAFGPKLMFTPTTPVRITPTGAINPIASSPNTLIGGVVGSTPSLTRDAGLTSAVPGVTGSDPTLTLTPPSGTPVLSGVPTSPLATPLGTTPITPAPTLTPVPIRFTETNLSRATLTAAIGKVATTLPGALQPWGTELTTSTAAVHEVLDWLNSPPVPAVTAPPPPKGTVDDAVRSFKTALDPRVSIVNMVRSRVQGLPKSRPDDLAPIMAAPEFPNPMYEPLAQIAQDLVLPGIATVPQNTLALLKINMRFVEAYMVGCNHEFAGELLWREYPTDQRGSYFRQFFQVMDSVSADSVNGAEPEAVPELFKDVRQLHTWRDSLGSHAMRQIDLVLLIRGDLLKKYPNTLVYAVPGIKLSNGSRKPNLEGFVASPSTGVGKGPVFPVITGSLPPDVTFFGFILKQEQVRSSQTSEGYYFVLEQRVGEPRFGIDETTSVAGNLSAWDDLAWTHFGGVSAGAYMNAAAPSVSGPSQPGWGTSSATIASILLQDPVRVAVHADDMLPKNDQ
jgi:hypothetical protein